MGVNMDYNNQNPYEQNGGTSPYSQNGGDSPYSQNGSTSPYTQNTDTQGQNNPFNQGSTQGQDLYGQSGSQQTQTGQGSYSQGQGTQDSGQNPYYQQNPYQQNPYQQNTYQQNPYQQSTYGQNPYIQNGYQQSPYQNYQMNQYGGEWEEPMSVKEWLIVDLLMLIPCVNLILVFVWAFSSGEKKSKSNFFKANLIFAGCFLAFYVLLIIIAFMAGFATMLY